MASVYLQGGGGWLAGNDSAHPPAIGRSGSRFRPAKVPKEESAPCNNSFTPDTPVLMADRTTKPIKDIKVGDKVLATDPKTGKTAAKRVTYLHDNIDRYFVDVRVANTDGSFAVIQTTIHHPFWDQTTHEWTDAGNLVAGHRLHTADGDVLKVAALRTFVGRQHMLNLTVDDLHTYYVMADNTPVLVHNCPPEDAPASQGSTGRTTAGGANEQQAMDLVRENAQYGNRLPVHMNDPRWPANDGWVKMEQTVNGVEVHYVYNARTGAIDDFKFKDWSE